MAYGLRKGTFLSVAKAFRCITGNDMKHVRSLSSVTSLHPRSVRIAFPSAPLFNCRSVTTPNCEYATDSDVGRLYHSAEATQDGKRVCVSWADGEERRYHAVWLRHNCKCPQCWDDGFSSPLVYHDSLRNVKIISSEAADDNLKVKFSYSGNQEEHAGYFPLQFLKKHSYSPYALQQKQKDIKPVIADHMPRVAYPDLMADEKHLWTYVVFPAIIDKEFQSTFEVEHGRQRSEDHLVQTERAIPYHSDLSGWSEYPPGLTLLHCIIFDSVVEGGETLVVDIFPVLEELKEKHPKQFETLCSVPASYRRNIIFRDSIVAMKRQKPHVIVDSQGEITSFSLHPYHEDPLSIQEDKVDAYYDAYCLMQEMLKSSKYQQKFRLQPGDVLSVNNRRCVHGRAAMKLNGGQRFVQGTCMSADDLKATMWRLAKKYESDFILKRTFNLDPL